PPTATYPLSLHDALPILDAALAGLWLFEMYAPDDPRVTSTMEAVRERLWVNSPVGGVARYENDPYERVSHDLANYPGNPWFVCTDRKSTRLNSSHVAISY